MPHFDRQPVDVPGTVAKLEAQRWRWRGGRDGWRPRGPSPTRRAATRPAAMVRVRGPWQDVDKGDARRYAVPEPFHVREGGADGPSTTGRSPARCALARGSRASLDGALARERRHQGGCRHRRSRGPPDPPLVSAGIVIAGGLAPARLWFGHRRRIGAGRAAVVPVPDGPQSPDGAGHHHRAACAQPDTGAVHGHCLVPGRTCRLGGDSRRYRHPRGAHGPDPWPVRGRVLLRLARVAL